MLNPAYRYAVEAPEATVRALACCYAARIQEPQPFKFNWAASVAEPYDSQDFWIPYGVFRGAYYMQPWAVALINYMGPTRVSAQGLAAIEPTSFYSDIRAQAAAHMPTGALTVAAEQAWQQATVEGLRYCGHDHRAEELDMLYALARQAADQGKLVTDPRKLKRLMAA